MALPAVPLTRSSSGEAPSARADEDSLSVASGGRAPSLARDLLALTKPRITSTVVATMLAGAHVAARSTATAVSAGALLLSLAGTVLVVSGANALNMYLERDSDRFMSRTRMRPLPAGRLAPAWALATGLGLGVAALPLLWVGGGVTTAALAAFAFAAYVGVYTPLKRVTSFALPVGAIPGAIPPLLGWTTVRGAIEPVGLLLFALMFLWQLPHFHAIGAFRAREYERAGLRLLISERGPRVTRVHAIVEAALLLPVTLGIVALGGAGAIFGVAATVLGVAFVAMTARADEVPARWGKRVFATSIGYLVLVLVALVAG